MILITGTAGFIGNFVHHWFEHSDEPVAVLDKLTYAGNPRRSRPILGPGHATLAQTDIRDRETVRRLLASHRPRALLHFAAESHVDRSCQVSWETAAHAGAAGRARGAGPAWSG